MHNDILQNKVMSLFFSYHIGQSCPVKELWLSRNGAIFGTKKKVATHDVQSTVEIIIVMKLPAEQTRKLSWRLGLSSALMVAHGHSGELQDNLLVRWSWWALAMVPLCFVVRPDGVEFVTTRSGMSAYHTEPSLLVGSWGHGCALLRGCVCVVGGCFPP